MTPFYFQSGSRRLLGLYDPPAGASVGAGRAAAGGVVLCNPFGQEAIRSHRMYRVLAERISRAGFGVLRFDYSCTGDSEGACTEARLADWISDVRAAEKEVVGRCAARQSICVGLRLGGAIAMLAAERAGPVPRQLALWDPVPSGAPYLEDVALAHIGFLSTTFRTTRRRIERSRNIQRLRDMTELVGFEVTAALRADLESIDLARDRPYVATRVTILGNAPPLSYASFLDVLARRGITTQHVPIDSDAAWNSEEALNASTIPARTLNAVQSVIEAST